MIVTATRPKEQVHRHTVRRERLETRVTADEKALLQRAADLEDRSLTEFVRTSAHAAAVETIRRHEVMTLSPEDSALFVEALMNPPEPNEHLRAAYQAYRERFGEPRQ